MTRQITHAIAISALLAAGSVLAQQAPKEPALRVVEDAARHRTWMLGADAVYLHEGGRKLRFELPGWVYVRDDYACAPDISLDAQGAAVVTSNVVPVVWRVEPTNGQVTRHELVLDADTDKDVGFTGLVYAPDQGAFFAVSGIYGSLWRIDPLLRRAQKVPVSTPLVDGCGLAVDRTKTRRSVVLCVEGMRTVHLAPDQRTGYVVARSCGQESGL